MARPKEVPAVAPTLPPVKAIPILENLILKAEMLHNERSDSGQRRQWTHTGEGALLAAHGDKHPNIQAFGAAQCGVYGPYDNEETFRRKANEQLVLLCYKCDSSFADSSSAPECEAVS